MTSVRPGPAFCVQDIPFSYFGSWFNISPVVAEHTYAQDLHLVSHQTGLHPVLRFTPQLGDDPAGAAEEITVEATPGRLTWRHRSGRIDLAYDNAETIRVRGIGLGLRLAAASRALTPFSGTYLFRDPVDGADVFTVYETGRRYRVTVCAGTAERVGAQALGAAERAVVLPRGGEWEIAIEEYATARPPYRSAAPFDRIAESAQAAFDAFLDRLAPWRGDDTPAVALAAYVLWSATVNPAGFLARPAVLMSKHWMDKVWSWDHCFNAIALADGHPGLAWDQFRLPFDHQEPGGALPDSVTHSEVLYNFVKPPIHGWALRHLRERLPAGHDLGEIYRPLADWTTFWLTHRRGPGQTLAHYQHGNDSGWDNATAFDPERVVQTADLAAHLILQVDELAGLARTLGHDADAADWDRTAKELRTELHRRLWTEQGYVTRGVTSGATWTSSSLLELTVIVLGSGLPAVTHRLLAARIEQHLTEHGLATEHPASPHYRADGYWRGPIWAPSTVLIEDGLRRAGYPELADRISHRFRRLCERSGFAENFDAVTGAGLRDRAYTWTASSYLIFARAHRRRTAG
jgi:glycogen debranching enzyme